jgi:hypothetical protein
MEMEIETWKRGYIDMEPWKHMEKWRHGLYMETWTWSHGHGYMETSNGKRKPSQFSLIHLPFANRAIGSLSFVPFVQGQVHLVCLQKNTFNLFLPQQTDK